MEGFAANVVVFNTEILRIIDRKKGLLNNEELEHLTKCLSEEVDEFNEAHDKHDFIGAIDSLIDLMYFAIGGLHKMGLSVEEMERCAEAVHYCNMAKRKGRVAKREVGEAADAVKPEDWVGPEQLIAEIIGGK